MYDFANKVAIVTGAAGGIGLATVKMMLECGASVFMADIAEGALTKLASELDPTGARLAWLAYDAADPAGGGALVDACTAKFGKLDYVVASAGIYRKQPILEVDDAQWHQMIGVNLDGPFFLARAAAPLMRDGGAIVNIASVAAHQGGTPGNAHYGASKGGLLAFTRGLAREIAPRLRANCISPGWIDTPMVADALATSGQQLLAAVPLGRAGQPREIAMIVGFLCSDASSFVTGEAIIAAGGALMC